MYLKTIIYECGLPNTLSGGFGDRIIGIISCMALCEFLGAKFYIHWADTALSDFFDYDAFAFDSHRNDSFRSFCCHSIEELKQTFYGKSRDQLRDLFNCDHLRFNTNQNLWQFLSINDSYETYTSRLFQSLFTSVLKPRLRLTNIVDSFVTKNGCVGIQLRFGDVIMNSERQQINNPQYNHFPLGNNVGAVEKMLRQIIEENADSTVFITSDINILRFFDLSMYPNITMYNKPSVHIERSVNKDGLDKCFVDFLVLCRCKKLYITAESNFGRCPGIISGAPVLKICSNMEIAKCRIREMACKNYIV
jgi:hypothetical protein